MQHHQRCARNEDQTDEARESIENMRGRISAQLQTLQLSAEEQIASLTAALRVIDSTFILIINLPAWISRRHRANVLYQSLYQKYLVTTLTMFG